MEGAGVGEQKRLRSQNQRRASRRGKEVFVGGNAGGGWKLVEIVEIKLNLFEDAKDFDSLVFNKDVTIFLN